MFDNDFDVGNEYDGRWVDVVTDRLGKLPPWRRIFVQSLCGVDCREPWLVHSEVTGRLLLLRLGGDSAGKSSTLDGLEVEVVEVNWDGITLPPPLPPTILARAFCDGDAGYTICCCDDTAGVLAIAPVDILVDVVDFDGRTVVVAPEFRPNKFRSPLKNPDDFGVVTTSVAIVGTE